MNSNLPNVYHMFLDGTYIDTRVVTSEIGFVDEAAREGLEVTLEEVQTARTESDTEDFDLSVGRHILSFLEL